MAGRARTEAMRRREGLCHAPVVSESLDVPLDDDLHPDRRLFGAWRGGLLQSFHHARRQFPLSLGTWRDGGHGGRPRAIGRVGAERSFALAIYIGFKARERALVEKLLAKQRLSRLFVSAHALENCFRVVILADRHGADSR